MLDHAAMFDPADAPDQDLMYANYLETCRRLGIEPASRERAIGLSVSGPKCYRGDRSRLRTSARAAMGTPVVDGDQRREFDVGEAGERILHAARMP